MQDRLPPAPLRILDAFGNMANREEFKRDAQEFLDSMLGMARDFNYLAKVVFNCPSARAIHIRAKAQARERRFK